MTYRPGDVVLLPFPYSDRNVSKRRPVLILTEPDTVDDVICVAVTSSPERTGNRFTLRKSDFIDGELPKESSVRLSKIYTINAGHIVSRFGALRPETFLRVREALCDQLGCRMSDSGLQGVDFSFEG